MTNIEILNIDKAIQDKLRGGYYTSPTIAKCLCNWAIRSSGDNILEPSCGDGVFIMASLIRLLELGASKNNILKQLVGIEIMSSEADKSIEKINKIIGDNKNIIIHIGDFFSYVTFNLNKQFDCVVGNPPFIRYQNFPEPSRAMAMSLLKKLGFRPNKLTNTWVPFVALSTICLAPGGRLAMVLPAELLQVSYASQLRSFLVDRFSRIDILTCNDLLFERAEQEIVLLLADGYRDVIKPEKCRINLTEVPNIEELLLKLTAVR